MSQGKYRPEIDGLRAIAVLAVVLFHAHVPGFGGGFVGVDVFFVISGFLITGILKRDLDEGVFSLAHFYERRIRRIFPALFVVLVAVFVLAVWLQFPRELSNTGNSLVATSLFLANYHFMGDTGYFATAAHSKPLLHMWSLAVEEQYYLVFPLVLAACRKYFRSATLPLVALLAALSFAYAVWLLERSADAAYYSAPGRVWQLLVGSLLALHEPRPLRRVEIADAIAVLGLVAVVASIVLYRDTTPFPGWSALPPTLGVAALIWATSCPQSRVGRLLRWQPLRGVGLISFSLYLWHWPVLVFHQAWSGLPPSRWETAALLVVCLVIAALSWRWVEQPCRRAPLARDWVLRGGFACIVLGASLGWSARASDGWPQRWSAEAIDMLATRDDDPKLRDCVEVASSLKRCRLGASGVEPRFILWGDSHAEAIAPALDAAGRSRGTAGWLLIRGGCPPLLGVSQASEGFDDCAQTTEAALRWIAAQRGLDQVWLAGRWALYLSGQRYQREIGPAVVIVDGEDPATPAQVYARGLQRTLARLRALPGVVPGWVAQVPEVEVRVPDAMARASQLGRQIDVAPTVAAYERRQAAVRAVLQQLPEAASMPHAEPADVLCGAEHCVVMDGTRPIYPKSSSYPGAESVGGGVGRPIWPTMRWQM